MSYGVLVYRRQGGTALVVATGGKIVMAGGKIVPGSETLAANIANVSTTTIAWTTADKAKVNTIIAALKGIGALATS